MKNTTVKITATTIAIFFSLSACAQKTEATKSPQLPAPAVQKAPENTTPAAPPPANETKLHETAVKQSSFSGPLPVKANDKAEPAKAQEPKPLPATDKLFPPNRAKDR